MNLPQFEKHSENPLFDRKVMFATPNLKLLLFRYFFDKSPFGYSEHLPVD